MPNPDITPQDALAIAQDALERLNELETRVTTLETENHHLRTETGALKAALEDAQDRPYDALTIDEKVRHVRHELYQRGQSNGRHAEMTYDDVMWSVFDGRPSADHCYKLMELAGDTTGFTYHDGTVGQKRVEVDITQANTPAGFSSANNAAVEGEDA